jgi:glyoxylase I family protein
MTHAVHHINIHTPDLDRLWAFYTEAFGFELVFEHYLDDFPIVETITGVKGASARVVTLKAKNCFVELFQWSAPKGRPLDPLRPFDFGYTHFAIAVDDVEAEHARLSALGMTFVSAAPPRVEVNGGVYGSIYGQDPDGNVIELTEIPKGDNMNLEELAG